MITAARRLLKQIRTRRARKAAAEFGRQGPVARSAIESARINATAKRLASELGREWPVKP
jgi:hypothetical protein